jgi:hypothetical protein
MGKLDYSGLTYQNSEVGFGEEVTKEEESPLGRED